MQDINTFQVEKRLRYFFHYLTPRGTLGPRTKNGTLTSNSKGMDFPFTKPNCPRW